MVENLGAGVSRNLRMLFDGDLCVDEVETKYVGDRHRNPYFRRFGVEIFLTLVSYDEILWTSEKIWGKKESWGHTL